MSDEDSGDLGERVTMPFKFVTGTSNIIAFLAAQ